MLPTLPTYNNFIIVSQLIKSPETERYTFEATLLLSFLANFHRSDAAKLNPYLQHIRDTGDIELMKKICWAANFACDAAVRYTGTTFNAMRDGC